MADFFFGIKARDVEKFNTKCPPMSATVKDLKVYLAEETSELLPIEKRNFHVPCRRSGVSVSVSSIKLILGSGKLHGRRFSRKKALISAKNKKSR